MASAPLADRPITVAGLGGSGDDVGGARSERLGGTFRRGLELMVLVGFAIAQPAFGVISKTPEFFALRESSRTEVILFALVMSVGIPAALLVLELLAGLAGRSVARGLHLGLLAVLFALFAIPLCRTSRAVPSKSSIASPPVGLCWPALSCSASRWRWPTPGSDSCARISWCLRRRRWPSSPYS